MSGVDACGLTAVSRPGPSRHCEWTAEGGRGGPGPWTGATCPRSCGAGARGRAGGDGSADAFLASRFGRVCSVSS